MAAAPTILWHIEISHYNEKARWALDYKYVPYELRTPLPGLHRITALALTRGKHDRLPVAEISGRRVADSTAIVAALEEYAPEPPLYPADPADRERALELEDYFDEELAPRVRRLIWHHTLGDTDATIDAVMGNAAEWRRRLMRALAPVVRPVVRRDYKVNAAGAEEAVEGIRGAMDRIEAELRPSGYLVGDSFSVADLTAAALSTPLIAPEGRPYAPRTLAPELLEVRAELEAREGGAWVHEMYARHRGRSRALAAA